MKNQVIGQQPKLMQLPQHSGLLHRKCACGKHTHGQGECAECRQKRLANQPASTNQSAPGFQHDFSQVATHTVHREGDKDKPAAAPKKVKPCSAADQTKTERIATKAHGDVLPYLDLADKALTNLHSAWINNKEELLAKTKTLSGTPVCAFLSNFNTSYIDADYGVNHIRVMSRLTRLSRRMNKPVSYVCVSGDSGYCTGEGDGATEAYVVNHQPPIYFCPDFTNSLEQTGQHSTMLHEYAHLLPGVDDKGGYAALGAGAMTCSQGLKFTAKTEDLVHTADAIAGFIMHVGQENSTAVKVSNKP